MQRVLLDAFIQFLASHVVDTVPAFEWVRQVLLHI